MQPYFSALEKVYENMDCLNKMCAEIQEMSKSEESKEKTICVESQEMINRGEKTIGERLDCVREKMYGKIEIMRVVQRENTHDRPQLQRKNSMFALVSNEWDLGWLDDISHYAANFERRLVNIKKEGKKRGNSQVYAAVRDDSILLDYVTKMNELSSTNKSLNSSAAYKNANIGIPVKENVTGAKHTLCCTSIYKAPESLYRIIKSLNFAQNDLRSLGASVVAGRLSLNILGFVSCPSILCLLVLGEIGLLNSVFFFRLLCCCRYRAAHGKA